MSRAMSLPTAVPKRPASVHKGPPMRVPYPFHARGPGAGPPAAAPPAPRWLRVDLEGGIARPLSVGPRCGLGLDELITRHGDAVLPEQSAADHPDDFSGER